MYVSRYFRPHSIEVFQRNGEHVGSCITDNKLHANVGDTMYLWTDDKHLLIADDDRGNIYMLERRDRDPSDTSPDGLLRFVPDLANAEVVKRGERITFFR